MKPREAVENRPESASKQWSIPSRLTLTVLPIAIMSLLLGLLLVWTLLSSADGDSSEIVIAVVTAAVVLVAVGGTLFGANAVGRSLARRITEVSSATRRVANKDLVELLDALRNPEPDLTSIAPVSLDTGPGDEVGDLARSFESLHGSLIEVGSRQMEALRAGVSSIFVTLARRNSSLVDRQLALLDQLESHEEDPEVLSGFYQLDHLAARMRRNAESLLVLAGSESPRVWAKATDMSDVVRAAISEIDEYQRIEVLALEPARLSGGAVSDVSHLLAELLENAIQFSPPSEMIRVTGLFDMEGYQLAVSDRGVGISEARLAEMNRILERPPALGLSVEPTLGMYVVAKLAHRHGLDVELIRGVPGLTARITIPREHLEVDVRPDPRRRNGEEIESPAADTHPPAPDHERPDPPIRELVSGRSGKSGAAEGAEQVIDLTESPYRERPDETVGGELPVRTPGLAYSDEDDDAEAVSPGDGPARIRAALSDYDRGRRSAADGDETEPAQMWNHSDPEDAN